QDSHGHAHRKSRLKHRLQPFGESAAEESPIFGFIPDTAARRVIHNARDEFGRRRDFFRAVHERDGLENVTEKLAADRTAVGMGLNRATLVNADGPVNIVAQQNFEFRAVHTVTLYRFSTRANSARPR